VGRLLDGAAVRLTHDTAGVRLKTARLHQGAVHAEYTDGPTLRLQLWQKSLVIDVSNQSGRARELSLGRIAGVQDGRTVRVPYLNCGSGPHPCVLLSLAGTQHVFTSLRLVRISGPGDFVIRRPYGVGDVLIRCESFDVDGRRLPAPEVANSPQETRVEPIEAAVKYVLRFDRKKP
jgi:hypothetical protein